MADSSTTLSKAERMRSTALDFCRSFGAGLSGPECLDKFFTPNPKITEHGPHWANERLPFLARTFTGRRHGQPKEEGSTTTCDDYYDLLTSTLALVPGTVTVPSKHDVAADPDHGIVTVPLQAKFKSVKTGKAWLEKFVYVLSDFDEDGKIGYQQLWADPLSAWLAVGGGD